MKQQINLYQSAIFERRKPLSASTMLALLLLTLATLVALGAAGQWQARRSTSQLEELQRRQATLQAQLADILGESGAGPTLLAQEVARLRSERDRRQALLGLVQASPAAAGGFSPYLAGLARQTVPGVWLRRISLQGGGKEITLEGSAARPEAVPRLVQQLAAEPAFAGVEFAKFLLSRGEEAGQAIDFRLDTASSKEKKAQ
ncbi:MAG: PilN domain-containing protein [Desulfuromonadales bacterium]|nr:PilN domain-containing protein [Desulfuromonadales bacterium]